MTKRRPASALDRDHGAQDHGVGRQLLSAEEARAQRLDRRLVLRTARRKRTGSIFGASELITAAADLRPRPTGSRGDDDPHMPEKRTRCL